jgi:chemotaxis protein CheX
MMVGCELEPASEASWKGAEFTAMVGLAGELCGVVSVRCSHSSASQVAALMLDLSPGKAAEHAWDALGELANMIAGNFKNKLNGVSDRCMLSIPTVITGADYTFRSLAVANTVTLWFAFQDMPLSITLDLQS